jgi:DNA-binding CsgD family transcriptional regulator
MYLSPLQVNLLGQLMSTLAEPLEEAEVRSRLGQQLVRIFDAQYYVSYVWDAGSASFKNGLYINMDPANLRLYEQYYQFHDPITPAMQQYRTAVRATDVLSQEMLRKTEFFNDFLAKDGLHWGVNLYAWEGPQNIGDIRLWRDRKRQNFSSDELQLLDFIRPAFLTALRRCRPVNTVAQAGNAAMPLKLSDREIEVARLMSCGLSDKEISRCLGISVATVRTHVGHAFRKQGVDNRIRLIQSLGSGI